MEFAHDVVAGNEIAGGVLGVGPVQGRQPFGGSPVVFQCVVHLYTVADFAHGAQAQNASEIVKPDFMAPVLVQCDKEVHWPCDGLVLPS